MIFTEIDEVLNAIALSKGFKFKKINIQKEEIVLERCEPDFSQLEMLYGLTQFKPIIELFFLCTAMESTGEAYDRKKKKKAKRKYILSNPTCSDERNHCFGHANPG